MDKLTVAMIVKDEEANLRRCLDSVKDIADEIVIVDTGSTDDTISIALDYTERVYAHDLEMVTVDGKEYIANFSEARNIALGYATGPWVFQIDADEELKTPDKVLSYLDSDLSAVWVRIVSEMPGGGEGMSYFPRLYRKEAARYQWRVHNQLIASGKHDFSDILIWHYGYNLSPEEMVKKYQRQENLLRMQVKEMPENSVVWSNYIRIFRAQRKWEEVEEAFAEFQRKSNAGEIENTSHGAQIILLDNLCAKIELRKYDEAIEQGKNLLKYYPGNIDAHHLIGGLYGFLGRPEQAIEHYIMYLGLIHKAKTEVQKTTLIWDSWAEQSQVIAWRSLGSAYMLTGKTELALLAYNKAHTLSGEEVDRVHMAFAYSALPDAPAPYKPVTLTIG